MRTDALIGLIAVCAIIVPLIAFVVLRRKAGLAGLSSRWWLALYAVAFLFQPLFLMRKHWEGAWVLSNPSLSTMVFAQVDNAWWEELAKLLAMVVIAWLARAEFMPLLRRLPSAIGLGFWAGLAYGAGEAVVLAILFTAPSLGPVFGMHTFTPFTIGWDFVYERFWAIQFHAALGALIGAGVWLWVSGKRWGGAAWFVVAMLYHHLVDGSLILASFVPAIAVLLTRLGPWVLPIFAAIGYGLIALAYFGLRRQSNAATLVEADTR